MRASSRPYAALLYACVAASFCGALLLSACGKDGSAPYAGWTTVTDSESVYRLSFLAPPWEITPSMSGDAGIALLVPPVYGSLDAGAPKKYALEARLVPGLAVTALDAEAARIGGTVLVTHVPFATLPAHDDHGFTTVLEDPTRLRYYRLVALAAPGSRALLVRVELNHDPRNDRELDAMLAAIDVRPFAD